MKKRFTFLATAITFLALAACNNNSGLKTETKTNEKKTDSVTTGQVAKTDKKKPSNMELLQGKWQSNDDKTNFLVFEKNHRKEIAEGMKKWDDEEFILSDHCQNDLNKADNNPKEKDRYMSCKKSDLCWYIESITSEKLVLDYMGRGNTLTYKKVKK